MVPLMAATLLVVVTAVVRVIPFYILFPGDPAPHAGRSYVVG